MEVCPVHFHATLTRVATWWKNTPRSSKGIKCLAGSMRKLGQSDTQRQSYGLVRCWSKYASSASNMVLLFILQLVSLSHARTIAEGTRISPCSVCDMPMPQRKDGCVSTRRILDIVSTLEHAPCTTGSHFLNASCFFSFINFSYSRLLITRDVLDMMPGEHAVRARERGELLSQRGASYLHNGPCRSSFRRNECGGRQGRAKGCSQAQDQSKTKVPEGQERAKEDSQDLGPQIIRPRQEKEVWDGVAGSRRAIPRDRCGLGNIHGCGHPRNSL